VQGSTEREQRNRDLTKAQLESPRPFSKVAILPNGDEIPVIFSRTPPKPIGSARDDFEKLQACAGDQPWNVKTPEALAAAKAEARKEFALTGGGEEGATLEGALQFLDDRYERCKDFTTERRTTALDALAQSEDEMDALIYANEVGDMVRLESLWARGYVDALGALAQRYPRDTYAEQVRWTAAQIAVSAIERARLEGLTDEVALGFIESIEKSQREIQSSVSPAVYGEAINAAKAMMGSPCCKLVM
jgi:hypothetical protein